MSVQIDYNNHDLKSESYWEFKGQLDFVDQWFLMGSPIPTVAILTTYILFVLKLGPDFMKKRKPYKLTNILLVYNIVQVIFAAYIFNLCIRMIVPLGLFQKTCNMETEESRYQATLANYWYFINKVTELLDTVFFVLRKKQNQATFLHVYHHILLSGFSWMLLKYEPGYSLLFMATINSFIHIIMYTYYGLSAFPGMARYLWWKKYITTMQLTQFCLALIHFVANTVTSECKVSKILLVSVLANLLLFIYLFQKFYTKTYINTNGKREQEKNINRKASKYVSDSFNGQTLEGRTKKTDTHIQEKIFNIN